MSKKHSIQLTSHTLCRRHENEAEIAMGVPFVLNPAEDGQRDDPCGDSGLECVQMEIPPEMDRVAALDQAKHFTLSLAF